MQMKALAAICASLTVLGACDPGIDNPSGDGRQTAGTGGDERGYSAAWRVKVMSATAAVGKESSLEALDPYIVLSDFCGKRSVETVRRANSYAPDFVGADLEAFIQDTAHSLIVSEADLTLGIWAELWDDDTWMPDRKLGRCFLKIVGPEEGSYAIPVGGVAEEGVVVQCMDRLETITVLLLKTVMPSDEARVDCQQR